MQLVPLKIKEPDTVPCMFFLYSMLSRPDAVPFSFYAAPPYMSVL